MTDERGWYLMFTAEDGQVLENLIGPFTAGQGAAEAAKDALMTADTLLNDGVDWHDPYVTGVPLFTAVQVIDLSGAEVDALLAEKAGGPA